MAFGEYKSESHLREKGTLRILVFANEQNNVAEHKAAFYIWGKIFPNTSLNIYHMLTFEPKVPSAEIFAGLY